MDYGKITVIIIDLLTDRSSASPFVRSLLISGRTKPQYPEIVDVITIQHPTNS